MSLPRARARYVPHVHFRKLRRGEVIATLGGALLAVALFLAWYHTKGLAQVAGRKGDISAWQAHSFVRYLLLAGALAPAILAYIVIRDHALSWPRGELTAVVAIFALGFIVYFGVIARPGTLRAETSLDLGWFVALAGGILMLYGAATRSGESERRRKPPGVL